MDLERIKRYGRRAGKEALAIAEASYLTMKDPNISFHHKSILLGSLVYFLSPLDALPDFLPGGFSDDLALMLAAVVATGTVGKHHLKECRLKYGLATNQKDDLELAKKTSPKPKEQNE